MDGEERENRYCTSLVLLYRVWRRGGDRESSPSPQSPSTPVGTEWSKNKTDSLPQESTQRGVTRGKEETSVSTSLHIPPSHWTE